MTDRCKPFLKFAFVGAFLLVHSLACAQLSASLKQKFFLKDSSTYSLLSSLKLAGSAGNDNAVPVALPVKKEMDEQLTYSLDDMVKKPGERKQLLSYLKSIEIGNTAGTSQAKARFYYKLANTFARLRLYPLAMKCFLKTVPKQMEQTQLLPLTASLEDSDSIDMATAPYFSISNHDDSLINKQVSEFKGASIKSKAITYQRVHQTFDDGKTAVAYAMLFHVKQPARGKRKISVWTNVGHTFITLIKYNADSTYTSVSLGFYPKKDKFLSATPLIPSTSSVFKDDSFHDWDEVLGKFITKKRFECIQGLILQYNGIKYNLSKNNCTDFGLKAAMLAGISINETFGTWPLGSGNNPAVTGQSIINNNFTNIGSGTVSVFVEIMK